MHQMRLRALAAVGTKLAELGFSADAVSVYSQALAADREIPAGSPNYIANREGWLGRCREGLTRNPRRPEDGGADRVARPDDRCREGRARGVRDPGGPEGCGQGSAGEEGQEAGPGHRPDGPVHPLELDKARVRSLLAEAIAGPTATPPSPDRLKELESLSRDAGGPAEGASRGLLGRDRRGPAGAGHRRREAVRAGARPARHAGRQDPAGGHARGCAGELAAARPGDATAPALGGRPRLLEAGRLGQAPRRRRQAGRPGDRGRPPTVRQPRADGHAPRAGRPRPDPRRPLGRRGPMGPDARDRHRAARPQGQEGEAGSRGGDPVEGPRDDSACHVDRFTV